MRLSCVADWAHWPSSSVIAGKTSTAPAGSDSAAPAGWVSGTPTKPVIRSKKTEPTPALSDLASQKPAATAGWKAGTAWEAASAGGGTGKAAEVVELEPEESMDSDEEAVVPDELERSVAVRPLSRVVALRSVAIPIATC